MVILISDKINFKAKLLLDRKTFYNNKRINLPRRYNNYKHICS